MPERHVDTTGTTGNAASTVDAADDRNTGDIGNSCMTPGRAGRPIRFARSIQEETRAL